MNFNALGMPEISLRHLKAMLYVAQYKNLTKAAQNLNRSQTAITKAICELEVTLGLSLFNRSPTGMIPTPKGAILVERVKCVFAEFEAAREAYFEYKKNGRQNIPIFSMEVSYKRLASIVVLHDHKDIGVSAKYLGVTRAAIYSSLRQLEELLDLPLFERSPYGFSSTAYCRVLVRHIKLAFSQLRHAIDEIASINGVVSGSLVIGTLPYSRTFLTPRAINLLSGEHPSLKISTEEASYPSLEAALRCGEIDLIVGAIRDDSQQLDLKTEKLFEDCLSIIVRKDHPLAIKKNLCFSDLRDYSWVLPVGNTSSRQVLDKLLEKEGLNFSNHYVETSSISNIRGLLLESDRLAFLSKHQVYYERKYGLLVELPLELKDTYRPIGITMRDSTQPSPAADLFFKCLKKVSDEIFIDNA